MPKQISRNDLDSIVKAVSTFPNGGGVEEIHSALEGKVPRRTLQRRLALLVEQKRLIVQGRARASRYHLPVAEISSDDRARFVEVIETELGCLHEGNFTRYQLRSSEFRNWKKIWL